MRILSYIVAFVALAAGMSFFAVVPKFRAIYEDLGVALPVLTEFFLESRGLLPGGVLVVLAVLIVVLVACRKVTLAGALSGMTLLFVILVMAVVPVVLMKPLSQAIHAMSSEGNDAEDPAAELAEAPDPGR